MSDSFNLVIQEPNDDTQFFAGDNSILLKALVRDQEHGIASLDFRLDSGQWVMNTFNNELQVEFETQVAVPASEAHTLSMTEMSYYQILKHSAPYFLHTDIMLC